MNFVAKQTDFYESAQAVALDDMIPDMNSETHPAANSHGKITASLLPWRTCDKPEFIAQWDRLSRAASEPNPFNESWYLLPALRQFDPEQRVRICALWQEGGDGGRNLIGLMPLSQEKSYGRWPIPHLQNWLHPNAFLGTPLVRSGCENAFWQAVLPMLDGDNGRSIFFHLSEVDIAGPVAIALNNICHADARKAALVHQFDRALLAGNLSPDDYYEAAVRSKKRKELRRQKNRLMEMGALQFTRFDDDEALLPWINEFLSLEKTGWKGAQGSALDCAPETREIFTQALLGAAQRGLLERLELRLDGKPLVMLVNFICAPGAFSYKTAYDEDYAKFSPGVLLQCENLALLELDELLWCDSCAAEGHPMIDSLWTDRRSIGRYSVAIGGPVRRAIFHTLLKTEQARTQQRAGKEDIISTNEAAMTSIFDPETRAIFAQHYPEIPHKIAHKLVDHPLLNLESLAQLGEALPEKSLEYNRGDLPIGIDPADVPANGMTIGETIRQVEQSGSWAVLKNIEQNPQYEVLLLDLLTELKPQIEAKTGKMMRPQGFIFVSSPDAVTPYHFDPEHNILLQLRGNKVMTQFPAGDARFAPDQTHESYQTGGQRNLHWQDEFAASGTAWHLAPGEALFVPVMAPHHVKNGPEVSISLSITWRSEWSFAEADARAFNKMIRKWGMQPRAPQRFPKKNLVKSYAWRAITRLKKSTG